MMFQASADSVKAATSQPPRTRSHHGAWAGLSHAAVASPSATETMRRTVARVGDRGWRVSPEIVTGAVSVGIGA